ncbi:hypothetical protein E2C01_038001 [Portunus trituberculatus]|uniref:Uncharacterized protein n=1 Tax=Portunus trituberculatus TaxID=210409 RepID=A0A5B7FHC9_PORTR|nr:hypothetical protein [Portunus trituberculatus]
MSQGLESPSMFQVQRRLRPVNMAKSKPDKEVDVLSLVCLLVPVSAAFTVTLRNAHCCSRFIPELSGLH